jgi:hypothetical protein
MSDRLAKSFDRHLAEVVKNDRHARRRLLNRGWKEFINTERPDTNSPAEMAGNAVTYLGLHDSRWMDEPQLIVSVFAFLKEQTGLECALEPKGLGDLLKKKPVVEQEVLDWFKQAFPDSPPQ